MHEPTKTMFSWGNLGVEVFFVVSGFIIPFVLFTSRYTLRDFGTYIGKRVIRICPPAYILITLTLAQFFAIDYLHLSEHKWFSSLTGIQLLHNYLFTADLFHQTWINGILWTLAIEFQFYLLIGLLFTIQYKNALNFTITSLLLCGIGFLAPKEYVWYFPFASLFAIGGATCLHFTKQINQLTFLALVALFSIVCYAQLGAPQAFFGAATALTIAFVQTKSALGSFLGKISYSLYLTHILIGSTMENILMKLFVPQTNWQKDLAMTLIIFIAIAGSYVYYLVVEKYFINLSNKIFKKSAK